MVTRVADQAVAAVDRRTGAGFALGQAGGTVDPGDRAHGRGLQELVTRAPVRADHDVVGAPTVGIGGTDRCHAQAAGEIVGIHAVQAVRGGNRAHRAASGAVGDGAHIGIGRTGPQRAGHGVSAIGQHDDAGAADFVTRAHHVRHVAGAVPGAAGIGVRRGCGLVDAGDPDAAFLQGGRSDRGRADQAVGGRDQAAAAAVGQLAGAGIHPGHCAATVVPAGVAEHQVAVGELGLVGRSDPVIGGVVTDQAVGRPDDGRGAAVAARATLPGDGPCGAVDVAVEPVAAVAAAVVGGAATVGGDTVHGVRGAQDRIPVRRLDQVVLVVQHGDAPLADPVAFMAAAQLAEQCPGAGVEQVDRAGVGEAGRAGIGCGHHDVAIGEHRGIGTEPGQDVGIRAVECQRGDGGIGVVDHDVARVEQQGTLGASGRRQIDVAGEGEAELAGHLRLAAITAGCATAGGDLAGKGSGLVAPDNHFTAGAAVDCIGTQHGVGVDAHVERVG